MEKNLCKVVLIFMIVTSPLIFKKNFSAHRNAKNSHKENGDQKAQCLWVLSNQARGDWTGLRRGALETVILDLEPSDQIKMSLARE